MKRAILTVGPQYAGKSTFCKRATKAFPHVLYVSRDEILVRVFGSTCLSPYTNDHEVGLGIMWNQIHEQLRRLDEFMLILDAWNGFPREREEMVQKLRRCGAERVDAWYFITPVEQCVEWSIKRQPPPAPNPGASKIVRDALNKSRKQGVEHDHRLFHSKQVAMDTCFNNISCVDPRHHKPSFFLERPSEQLLLRGVE